jgi:hypothetical protein
VSTATTPTARQGELAERAFRYLLSWSGFGTAPTYYGDVGLTIGAHHRNVGSLLDIVAAFCADHDLPPLTAYVALWETGEVSGGHAEVSSEPPAIARRRCHNWSRTLNLAQKYALAAEWAD